MSELVRVGVIVSAPADQDASQLYYSYCIIKGGGGGGCWGKGEVVG